MLFRGVRLAAVVLMRLLFVPSVVVAHGVSLYFFFQAEDGIRALIVTGVQTCALPI